MTKTGLNEAGILCTLLTILEMIRLEVLGSEGEDDLGTVVVVVVVLGGSSTAIRSSSSSISEL
jgi:hypothetical protein